ncbi:MAG: GGDEF domain-containing phosphodiesterase, partial [Campylobacteraceae bacterium]|nr:GGDEF domain-containing phosphodiesterase [Campylobacteraceae bacterium]
FCPLYLMFGVNKKYAKKIEFLSDLPNNNPEPIYIFDDNCKIIYQNKSSKTILPNIKNFSSITKKNPKDFIASELQDSIKFKQNNNIYMLKIKGSKDKNGIFTYGFNITQLENYAKKLLTLSLSDTLTNLGNRHKLLEDISKNSDKHLVVFVLDIKNFKQINNFFGHKKADDFLIEFSKKLEVFQQLHKLKNNLYRLQANSFVLLFNFKSRDIQNEKIEIIKNELFAFFKNVLINIQNVSVDFDLRIGIAAKCDCDDENNMATELLNNAEITLLVAKQKNLNYLSFDKISYILDEYKENFQWAKRLKDIFANKSEAKILPYFQPIYNLKTQKIEKFEALVRIEEGNAIISPFYFLDIAKNMNLLPEITKKILTQSLEKFKNSDFEFSINISYQDLREENLVNYFLKTLKKYNFPTNRVVIEILEDENMYEFIEVITNFKKEGFKIAIDDFGTGYSNFQKLQKLNADYLKIDGSLVKNIANNPKDLSIMTTICTYAKTIGVKTIAEFVADKKTFELVKQSGVDYAQGYFIGAPIPDTKVIFNDK